MLMEIGMCFLDTRLLENGVFANGKLVFVLRFEQGIIFMRCDVRDDDGDWDQLTTEGLGLV